MNDNGQLAQHLDAIMKLMQEMDAVAFSDELHAYRNSHPIANDFLDDLSSAIDASVAPWQKS
jgi:hypothetical protein